MSFSGHERWEEYLLCVAQAIDPGSVELGVAELVEGVEEGLNVVDALDADCGTGTVSRFETQSHGSRSCWISRE